MPLPPPDRFEKGVRFGCGALAGLVLGIGAAVGMDWNARELAGILALAALIFGGCAAAFGDRFWLMLARLLSFW